MQKRGSLRRRKGAIAVLAAVTLIVFLSLLALSVEVGRLNVARTEAQRTADAAAMASVGLLLEQRAALQVNPSTIVQLANEYSHKNQVSGGEVTLARTSDVVTGRLSPENIVGSAPTNTWNAVKVFVRLDGGTNARMPLAFARVLNQDTAAIRADATAVFTDRFRGFRAITGGKGSDDVEYPPLLPFTLPLSDWQNTLAGDAPDDFAWNPDENRFTPGQDGRHEINLYPLNLEGGGNFGTVDMGSDNSNTPRLRKQIRRGLSPAELEFHGGSISLDTTGRTFLSADPGLKAGIERDLKSIIGQPRIIPLHTALKGSGQSASYEIRGFAGVRIIDVELGGNQKHVLIQSAAVITRTGIPDDRNQENSFLIFSPVRLQD
jgi:hypothetical protein